MLSLKCAGIVLDNKWLYGRAISKPGTSDARLRFLSVSAISSADPRENGCLRKWYYNKVLGRKVDQSKAAKRGDVVHAEIAKYLRTGEKALGSLALSGMHFIPNPGNDLLVEHELLLRPGMAEPVTYKDGEVLLATAPLTAAGIPILGRLDLIHARGVNKGVADIEDTRDPEGTVEVLDWKSTGSPTYIKKPKDLPKLIQMAGYGEWVYRVFPRATFVRLSHGYFVERGGPSRKVSLRVMREDIEDTWKHAEGITRCMIDAARESDVDKVDANTDACDAYGGCPYRKDNRGACTAGMSGGLVSFVGKTAAENILNKRKERENSMALNLLNKARTETPAVPAAPAPASGGGLSGLLGTKAAAPVADEMAKLQAEEKAHRDLASMRQLLAALDTFGFGQPHFGQNAARLYAAAKGYTDWDISKGYGGAGKLGVKTVFELDELASMVKEIQDLITSGAIAPEPAAPAEPPPPALLAPEAPVEAAPAPVAPANAAADAEPKKRGRKPKVVNVEAAADGTVSAPVVAAPPTDVAQNPQVAQSVQLAQPVNPATSNNQMINVYVDCMVDGVVAQTLNGFANDLCEALTTQFNAADVRCAPQDSPLGFGKWKGALAALTRETELSPGTYILTTRGNEAYEVIADALRARAVKSGGVFVWGMG